MRVNPRGTGNLVRAQCQIPGNPIRVSLKIYNQTDAASKEDEAQSAWIWMNEMSVSDGVRETSQGRERILKYRTGNWRRLAKKDKTRQMSPRVKVKRKTKAKKTPLTIGSDLIRLDTRGDGLTKSAVQYMTSKRRVWWRRDRTVSQSPFGSDVCLPSIFSRCRGLVRPNKPPSQG